MIRAFHVIMTAYGFWLPNDPRGSWSEFVGSWEIFQHGPATKRRLAALSQVQHMIRNNVKLRRKP